MYLQKLSKVLAPITCTMSDNVFLSFPVPTQKGMCVFYYCVNDAADDKLKTLKIVNVAMVQADTFTQVSAEEAFPREILRSLQMIDPTASFSETFAQRKKCEGQLDQLIADTGFDVKGFEALKKADKSKLEQFSMDLLFYASLMEQEMLYASLLNDLYYLLSVNEYNPPLLEY